MIKILILDVKSEMGAQVRSTLCYLKCLSHLFRSDVFYQTRLFFVHECAKCSTLPYGVDLDPARRYEELEKTGLFFFMKGLNLIRSV